MSSSHWENGETPTDNISEFWLWKYDFDMFLKWGTENDLAKKYLPKVHWRDDKSRELQKYTDRGQQYVVCMETDSSVT